MFCAARIVTAVAKELFLKFMSLIAVMGFSLQAQHRLIEATASLS
jgi:hypothetical protein